MHHYNHANVSFCQKERIKVLELDSVLRVYLHYATFVFYNLNSRRLEAKFNVTYIGEESPEQVWLSVKSYYSFILLIEEVCLSESELMEAIRNEGLTEQLADAFRFYKSMEVW